MHKLKPEIKERWITALTDGSYAQTKSALHTAEGFCCLGVLCDLYDANHWKPYQRHVPEQVQVDGSPRSVETVYRYIPGHPADTYEVMPPESVTDWAGLGVIEAGQLATMNDGGYSFATIAAHIKENL